MASDKKETFPGVIHQLEAGDKGFKEGKRLTLTQLDCEVFYFVENSRLQSFMHEQGFVAVSGGEMEKLRAEYDKVSDDK